MKTEETITKGIVEHVRSIKEAIAEEHDYDVHAMIAAARARQEQSGRTIIRTEAGKRTSGWTATPDRGDSA
jgi:hypothetical protein